MNERKFKVGDRIREAPLSHVKAGMKPGWILEHWNDCWSKEGKSDGIFFVTGISDDYVYYSNRIYGSGPMTNIEWVELVEEEPQITVGSKWSFNREITFIVEILSINSDGSPVIKACCDDSEGEIKTGDIFEYHGLKHGQSFLDNYSPYVEKQKIVGWIPVVKFGDELKFSLTFHGPKTEEEAIIEARDRIKHSFCEFVDVIRVEYEGK